LKFTIAEFSDSFFVGITIFDDSWWLEELAFHGARSTPPISNSRPKQSPSLLLRFAFCLGG